LRATNNPRLDILSRSGSIRQTARFLPAVPTATALKLIDARRTLAFWAGIAVDKAAAPEDYRSGHLLLNFLFDTFFYYLG